MNIYEYILLSKYIYIYELCVFCFYCNIVATHTHSHSYDLFQLILLAETAYTIVIQVINKEARAT